MCVVGTGRESGVNGNCLYFLLSFAVNLKLLYKIKLNLKKKKLESPFLLGLMSRLNGGTRGQLRVQSLQEAFVNSKAKGNDLKTINLKTKWWGLLIGLWRAVHTQRGLPLGTLAFPFPPRNPLFSFATSGPPCSSLHPKSSLWTGPVPSPQIQWLSTFCDSSPLKNAFTQRGQRTHSRVAARRLIVPELLL